MFSKDAAHCLAGGSPMLQQQQRGCCGPQLFARSLENRTAARPGVTGNPGETGSELAGEPQRWEREYVRNTKHNTSRKESRRYPRPFYG